jgi:hypothetical protein
MKIPFISERKFLLFHRYPLPISSISFEVPSVQYTAIIYLEMTGNVLTCVGRYA